MSNPNLKYRVFLTAEERQELLEVAKNGKKAAREVRYANVLLMADEKATEGRWRDISLFCHFPSSMNRKSANYPEG